MLTNLITACIVGLSPLVGRLLGTWAPDEVKNLQRTARFISWSALLLAAILLTTPLLQKISWSIALAFIGGILHGFRMSRTPLISTITAAALLLLASMAALFFFS